MNTMKQLREQGLSKALARAATRGLAERAERVRKNKPVHGLAGIENPEGEAWLRGRKSREP